jgi:hypothetical protein
MHRFSFPLPDPSRPPAMAVAAALALLAACSQAPGNIDGHALSPDHETPSDAIEQADAGVRVPERFQGEWQGDPGACGTSSEGRLHIGPESVRFHESNGTVQALHVDEERLDVALQLRGEGHAWEATYRFRLSDDGRRLTDLSSGNGMVRLRCP